MAEEEKFGVKNPNEGTDGKMASNMTGEAINPNYDYGNITDSDKRVVNEIIDLLNARGDVPCSMFAEELKTRFQIVEIPMKPIENSIWHQFTKNERIGLSVQGFRESKDEEGNKIRIPHIGFSADLDYLDEMIQRIAKKVREIPEEK
jgi:transcriptional regulator CtsR